MAWEERLFALFDDLEQQAGALFEAERGEEVADRARAEYAAVGLAARLMAGVGGEVTLGLDGVGSVSGRLARVADGWCLLAAPGQEWVVPLPAVSKVRGLPPRAVPEEAWPVTSRLGLGSALRRVAAEQGGCRLRLRDGTTYDARLGRVGQDFVEACVGDRREAVVVAFTALAAVHHDVGAG